MKMYNCLNCNKESIWGHQKTNKYCSIPCQHEYQYKVYIAEWKQGVQDGKCGKLQTSRYVHRYVLEKQNYQCAICGISTWNDLKITLELDHVDGDSTNNSENNLRCLCPNCHSQTDTYKAKNKGKGRQQRGS